MGAWQSEIVALMVTPVYKKCNIESRKSCPVFAAQNYSESVVIQSTVSCERTDLAGSHFWLSLRRALTLVFGISSIVSIDDGNSGMTAIGSKVSDTKWYGLTKARVDGLAGWNQLFDRPLQALTVRLLSFGIFLLDPRARHMPFFCRSA
jgi:hypothetical protein